LHLEVVVVTLLETTCSSFEHFHPIVELQCSMATVKLTHWLGAALSIGDGKELDLSKGQLLGDSIGATLGAEDRIMDGVVLGIALGTLVGKDKGNVLRGKLGNRLGNTLGNILG
jgi:hypothetical protein